MRALPDRPQLSRGGEGKAFKRYVGRKARSHGRTGGKDFWWNWWGTGATSEQLQIGVGSWKPSVTTEVS